MRVRMVTSLFTAEIGVGLAHRGCQVEELEWHRADEKDDIGYGLVIKTTTDYPGDGAKPGWARIPAIRHAMATYKHSEYFWYLDQDAIIMNPSLSLENHVLSQLSSLMRRDVPIVPPNSV